VGRFVLRLESLGGGPLSLRAGIPPRHLRRGQGALVSAGDGVRDRLPAPVRLVGGI